jgi:uracil-DNA glycosylase family 4
VSIRRPRILEEMGLWPIWRLRRVAQAPSPACNEPGYLVQGVHHRGYLPHLKAHGGIYFVTFRLADSLPVQVLNELGKLPQEERSARVDDYLDAGHGECWLNRSEIAAMVGAALVKFAGKQYALHAWVIMPNHVHLVIEPFAGYSLSEILQGIKSASAHTVNRLLKRSGEFWQRESYDHLIRDDEDMARCCDYVVQNPVRAKLVARPDLYRFSSAFCKNAGEGACATSSENPHAGEGACATSSDSPPAREGACATRRSQILAMSWPELKSSVVACTACRLHERRTQAVFGVGDEKASWLFVGEGPGADEDRLGEPFVGAAGKLLDNMLKAIGIKRGDDVYIANAVKCRPPGNRNPERDEMAECAPYLQRQIALIEPRLIVILGKVAAQALLATDASIASLRGRVHRSSGIPIIVTYHPAYLLRNLPDKAKAWADLCLARQTMEQLQLGNL